jgi:hypothetical protein
MFATHRAWQAAVRGEQIAVHLRTLVPYDYDATVQCQPANQLAKQHKCVHLELCIRMRCMSLTRSALLVLTSRRQASAVLANCALHVLVL